MQSSDRDITDLSDEYERLTRAGECLARAAAELTHAASLVGDHSSAIALSELLDRLQITRATLAASAERAFSLAQIAIRQARYTSVRGLVDNSLSSPPDAEG